MKSKAAYVPPAVTEVGAFADLVQGFGSLLPDFFGSLITVLTG